MKFKTKNVTIALLFITGISIGLWFFSSELTKDKIVGLVTFATPERQCFNYFKEGGLKDPDSAYLEGGYILTRGLEMKLDKESNERIYKTAFSNEDWEFKFFKQNAIFKDFNSVIRISVKAKNSYGGYVSNDLECGLNDGKFSRSSFRAYQTKEAISLINEKVNKGEELSDEDREFMNYLIRDGQAATAEKAALEK